METNLWLKHVSRARRQPRRPQLTSSPAQEVLPAPGGGTPALTGLARGGKSRPPSEAPAGCRRHRARRASLPREKPQPREAPRAQARSPQAPGAPATVPSPPPQRSPQSRSPPATPPRRAAAPQRHRGARASAARPFGLPRLEGRGRLGPRPSPCKGASPACLTDQPDAASPPPSTTPLSHRLGVLQHLNTGLARGVAVKLRL